MGLLDREGTDALGQLAAATDADHGARLYCDRGDGVLELLASVRDGTAVDPEAAGGTSHEDDGNLLQRLLRPGHGDGGSVPGAVAHLLLPDERGSLLILERHRSEPFSDEDLALARVQARRLVERVATRLGPRPIAWSAQLEAIQSVAAELTRLTSVEQVAATLCSQARRVVAYDNARVYVLHEDGLTLEAVAFRPHAPEYEGLSKSALRMRVGEGITGWVAATGQPTIVDDTAGDPRAIRIPGGTEVPEESMILAPLRSEDRVIGVVVLARLGLARFADDELRLLGVLADQAAVAIENARLLMERDRHVAELAALLDLSHAGGAATDERDLATVLAGKLRDAARMDACVVSRWDADSGQLVPMGAKGRPLVGPDRDLSVHRTLRRVLLNGEPAWVDPATESIEQAERSRLHQLGAQSALLLPLSTAGQVTGLVELLSETAGRRFRAGELELLQSMASQAASSLENARLVRQLRDAAETDLVTGVYSHRHLQDRLRQETARAARARSPLSVLMIDLDGFKGINDAHGHQAGDRVLRSVAGALRAAVRTNDVVARYGGDEFVVVMPDTDAEEAGVVAARAEEAIAGVPHSMPDGSDISVACSAGLALHPRDGRTGKELLRAADAAMYRQKHARRAVSAARQEGTDAPVAAATA